MAAFGIACVAPLKFVVELIAPLVMVTEIWPYGALAPLGRSGSKPRLFVTETVRFPAVTVADATVAGSAIVLLSSPAGDVNAGTGATTVPPDWQAGCAQSAPSVVETTTGAGMATKKAVPPPFSAMFAGRICATFTAIESP